MSNSWQAYRIAEVKSRPAMASRGNHASTLCRVCRLCGWSRDLQHQGRGEAVSCKFDAPQHCRTHLCYGATCFHVLLCPAGVPGACDLSGGLHQRACRALAAARLLRQAVRHDIRAGRHGCRALIRCGHSLAETTAMQFSAAAWPTVLAGTGLVGCLCGKHHHPKMQRRPSWRRRASLASASASSAA